MDWKLEVGVQCFVGPQADFPTVIGVTLDREDGSTPMETDMDKGKQSGHTYYIDTNQLRVPRENMEVMSPLKNGMSKFLYARVWVYLTSSGPIGSQIVWSYASVQ